MNATLEREQRIAALREKYGNDLAGNNESGMANRRYGIMRILKLVEVLATRRHSLTLAALTEELQESFPVCERTIRRDVEALESLGLVDRVKAGGNVYWRWADDQMRAVIHERNAELMQQRTQLSDPPREVFEAVR